MKQLVKCIFITLLFVLLLSCGSNQIDQNKPVENKTEEDLIKVNKYMVKKDVELIKAYIKRRSWVLAESESGLWFEIYKKSSGLKVKMGSKISISYKLELLDGSLCYSSDSLGLKTFIVGKGEVENGLDEGVRLMHEGDAAHFISSFGLWIVWRSKLHTPSFNNCIRFENS
jgi:FKBP-type peptidyl-prolyl cis-trans isomerase FkpA